MKREICETCDYYNEEWLEEWSNDCGGYTKEELCEEDCGDWYEEMLIGRFDED